ncbi:leucine-rich repeat extensin-like protein 6 [Hyposmocoma kahamanoa]|uniref:leucine-rich repeat extensin-like protein 6 n=1 Tax=Hyposmocoma kahamanoa TaxID=1477025 RepID=UPI000E6D6565|nr:leucine-rich repeat extensin-like protein 6 [Hyposmocoma kahamanoa]
MMKVLTLIVSLFILISRSDASTWYPPVCGCKPDITPICANNGKTYSSVCEMKCDYNYVGLQMVSYGPCEDNSPIPIPVNVYPPPYQPDQYYPIPPPPRPSPPPPSPRPVNVIYYPQNVPGSIGASRPLAGSAPPHRK